MKQMRVGFDEVQRGIFRKVVSELDEPKEVEGIKAYGHVKSDVAMYLYGSYGDLDFCYTKPRVGDDSEAFDLLVLSEASSQERILQIDSFIREYVTTTATSK